MEEKGGGGGEESSLRILSPLSNERQRFTVELRPGETTTVSWKKLMKTANKANRPPPLPEPPSGAHPALESRIAPGQPAESELKEAPPSHRFNAVIEKIERLYMGKQSSDEEELDDVPDDDQYDTGDSFIDDAELDEYFQVDKSATKHDGFFVNRGKLERINEPISSPHKPKKRRRKDMTKARGEKDNNHFPNKHAKLGNVRMKAVARTAPLVGKSSTPSQNLAGISEHYQDGKSHNQLNAPIGYTKKKSADPSTKLENSSYSKISNRDDSSFPVEANDIETQKAGIFQSKDLGNEVKVVSGSSDIHQKYRDKSASTQLDPQSRRLLHDTNEVKLSTKVRHREKNGNGALPDLNFPESKYPVQTMDALLCRCCFVVDIGCFAFAEVTLWSTLDALFFQTTGDISRALESQTCFIVTIRKNFGKGFVIEVCRQHLKMKRQVWLAVGSWLSGIEMTHKMRGLMRCLGYFIGVGFVSNLMQKTPPMHVKEGSSVRPKVTMLERAIRELEKMVAESRPPTMEIQDADTSSQAVKRRLPREVKQKLAKVARLAVSENRDGASVDFQEAFGSEEKGVVKVKYSMDDAMEDKICDLYDQYVELAELWPNGAMDNHGIKNSICRAKERKRALYSQLKHERSSSKKLSASRMEEIVHGEASSIAQSRTTMQEDSSSNILTSPSRTPSMTTANHHLSSPVRMPSPSMSGSTRDRLKQEKVKGNTSTFPNEARRTMNGALMKKKEKRKPESNLGVTHYFPESQQGKEKHKSHKQTAGSLP
ncbi:hypothetical protein HHK36_007756 [Tetracentron sinense]|uniref:Hpc2-related domain-containing protein n=1 Tax=Tetracentron sinense TaxID=13715 RepID=A0A835DMR5_TETSI|nr:hypothetical protein HHK36_007756 [Tetracentron sinense]